MIGKLGRNFVTLRLIWAGLCQLISDVAVAV